MNGIRRGVSMAMFDGWSISVFAILTFLGGIFGGLIVVAVFGQGSLVLFYWRRQMMVREYLSQTPQGIVQMQRAGVGV